MATTKHIHQQIDMLSDFSFEINHEVVERAFKAFRHPLQVQIDVARMENLTHRLSDEYLDLDLLDEQTRKVLGMIRADEIVIR